MELVRADLDPHNYTYMFNAEKTYNEHDFNSFMEARWADCFKYTGVYLILIFAGQEYMRKQKVAYDLRPYLTVWSTLLAVFSIFGSIRTLPVLLAELRYKGLEYTCCDPSYFETGTVISFWTMLFTLSKVLELGDTMFIILRKQRLIFLHWYHHTTVLIYVWYSYAQYIATGRWFMVMNYLVHSFMYSYYALRAMKFRFPRWVSVFITSLQLVQMVMGITVTVIAYYALQEGRSCSQNYSNIQYSLLIYLSYFLLFAQFFYSTYVTKPIQSELKKNL